MNSSMNCKPCILLLHGFMGDRNVAFFPTLRARLERRFDVVSPSLSSPAEPVYEVWATEVERALDGRTVSMTIAHSLGGTLAMNMICQQRLSCLNLMTIGSSHGSKDESVMNGFLIPPIEVSYLKNTLENFWAVSSYDDPCTHHEYSALLVKQAGAVGLFFSDQGHFESEGLPDEVIMIIEHVLSKESS